MHPCLRVSFRVAAFAALTAFAAFGGNALAQSFDVKIAHASPPSTSLHVALERVKLLAEQRSGGRLKMTIYHSQQLMGQRESVEGLQLGTVEIVGIPNGIAAGFADAFFLFDIPFQFASIGQARAFVDQNTEKFVFGEIGKAGFVGLGVWEQGYRNLATSKKPVRTVEDLKDMKIRTLPAPMHVLAWRSMGANPTPMGWGQVYTSLQQGVVEGLEVPDYLITQSKLEEVVKNVMTTQHLYDPIIILGSKKWFDKMPADLQKIVKDVVHETTGENRHLNQKDVDEAVEKFPKVGVQYIKIDPAERKKFAAKAQPPVIEEVRKRLGNQRVDEWLATIAKTKDM